MTARPSRDSRLEAIYGQLVRDPRLYLRELLGIMGKAVAAGWHQDPEKKKLLLLRRGQHKAVRELRDACIFCCLIEQVLQVKISVAVVKDQNHDADVFALWTDADGHGRFCPIQMKELPPGYLNPTASLDALLLGLKKYPSPDTVVAVYLNRKGPLGVFTIPPGLRLAGLWLFGSSQQDASQWELIGDLLRPDHERRTLSLGL